MANHVKLAASLSSNRHLGCFCRVAIVFSYSQKGIGLLDYLVLLGILIVIVGFALRLDAILIIFAAAIVTALVGGIGAPFVLAFGANPAVVGVLALTCGYCGTLLTPMAANFNIVPVALLEMKDRMGVIKNQILPALVMISVQIVYMLIAS